MHHCHMFIGAQDVQRLLSQLIMLNGLCTNSDVPGTEKMVVTSLDDGWLKSPRNFLSVSDIGAHKGLLPPESDFMVKGWNRGVCGIICMLAAVECEDLRKARHWEVRQCRSFDSCNARLCQTV